MEIENRKSKIENPTERGVLFDGSEVGTSGLDFFRRLMPEVDPRLYLQLVTYLKDVDPASPLNAKSFYRYAQRNGVGKLTHLLLLAKRESQIIRAGYRQPSEEPVDSCERLWYWLMGRSLGDRRWPGGRYPIGDLPRSKNGTIDFNE